MSVQTTEINLIDSEFSHLTLPRGVCGKIPTHIRWVRNQYNYGGITVYTDRMIDLKSVQNFGGKYKIAWLIEPPTTFGTTYNKVIALEDVFDEIWTYNIKLLNRDSNKYRLCIHGGAWSNNCSQEVSDARKKTSVSMIFSSNKKAPGHKLRHNIHETICEAGLENKVVFSGSGTGVRLPHHPAGHGISSGPREKILLDSLFNIVVESNNIKNYFTEKLIDSLILKTVPIFWGCPNIDEFFDTRGIVIFKDSSQICEIVGEILLNPAKIYEKYLPYVENNYNLAKNYMIPEDWIYKHRLNKKMEKKCKNIN